MGTACSQSCSEAPEGAGENSSPPVLVSTDGVGIKEGESDRDAFKYYGPKKDKRPKIATNWDPTAAAADPSAGTTTTDQLVQQ